MCQKTSTSLHLLHHQKHVSHVLICEFLAGLWNIFERVIPYHTCGGERSIYILTGPSKRTRAALRSGTASLSQARAIGEI
jgi:hypothetical protein